MRTASMSVVAALVGLLLVGAVGTSSAEQANFSLAMSQSTTIGGYTLRYTGLIGGWPTYQLLGGGGVATLPSNPLPVTCCQYNVGNVTVVTTAVAADGSTVTGTMTVR